MRHAAVAILATFAAATAAFAAPPPTSATDYLKRAGNFLKNCDARADATGTRPEPNYVCLAFMAGLVEGYTTAAIANGNPKPYCLPRPASLAELADMMTTVIERGVPATVPTAAVFHHILQTNFKCDPDEAGEAETAPRAIETAQAAELLKVTPPAEVEASEPKLPIVKPAGPAGRSSEPLLRITEPSNTTGAVPSGDDARPTSPTPRASPSRPQPPAGVAGPAAPGAEAAPATGQSAPAPAPAETPPATQPTVLPGTSVGPGAASGPEAAVGAESGFGGGEGPQSAVGPSGQVGPGSAEGPVAAPRVGRTDNAAPQMLENPQGNLPAPFATPATPSTPAQPQPPRPATSN